MPSLKEILAAKKAAAQQAEEQSKPEQLAASVSSIVATEPEPVAEQPEQPQKPLTFAEKLALKKQGIQIAQTAPPPAPPKAVEVHIDPDSIPSDPVEAQAYVDIKTRIANLEAVFDDDLRNAMRELKEALKKNPAASEILLDSDVGKMVTALRRMTHVEIVAAKTPGKPGRKSSPKAKDVQLTAEQIQAALDEL